MSKIPDTVHQDTLAARYAVDTDEAHGAVIPPLYMSSNFSFEGFGEKREYDYTRSGSHSSSNWPLFAAAVNRR